MISTELAQQKILQSFANTAKVGTKAANAYLLVHSDKLGLHTSAALGTTHNQQANVKQPLYMASVGKLFTATLVAMLHEQSKISFDDPVSQYLDHDLMDGLHVYRKKDYSGQISIRHLLNQTSGLYDSFWPLLKQMLGKPGFNMEPRDAIEWGKENLKPKTPPGYKHYYTDTNYYLLGLIIEKVTGMSFYEAMHQYVFDRTGMDSAFMFGKTRPKTENPYPLAQFFFKGADISQMPQFAGLDFAGGSVCAPMADLLVFMQALVNGKLVSPETLEIMLSDDARGLPGTRYGYAVWKYITIPLILPERYNCWGCVGASGAFLFYHPRTESYLIGNFNDVRFMSSAIRFMISKVIGRLLKVE